MKKIFNILLYPFFSLLLVFNSAAASTPEPPALTSTIGYLLIQQDLEVMPHSKRFMIMPHAELLVLKEDMDAFTLIYPGKVTATCCIVPKYAKNMVLLRKSYRANYISFRGPVEANTVPFLLHKGEEIPIIKRKDGLLYLTVVRKKVPLTLIIAENTPGTQFSTQSEFAKFAAIQKKKGLVYFKKQWMPEKVAERIRKDDDSENLRKSQIWNNMKRAADLGVVVLKSGAVLNGKVTGNSEYKILFESKKRDYMIGIDDVAPITFSEIMARDKLDKAAAHLDEAKKNLKDKRGSAMYHAEQAMKNLKDIPASVKTEYATAKKMIAEVASLIASVNRSLTKAGEAIYHDTVFPVNILNYHLKRGDILLRKKYWLKPEQLCDTCHASGKLTCPTCLGKGRLIKDCTACIDGRVTCLICHGTGRKKCSYCNGKGYIYIEKKQSTVVASFGGYGSYGGYYPRCGGGTTLYSKGRYMFFQPGNYYDYPHCQGSSISVGNEEKAVKKVCPVCGGTGTVSCPKTEKCTKCDGVGYFIEVCPTCKGEKNIPCNKCNGKGFHGKPQQDPEEKKATQAEDAEGAHSYFNAPVVIP